MLRELVESKLSGTTPCFRHCSEAASLRFLQDEKFLIGAYVCPSGYVSRLVMYGEGGESNPSYLKEIVKKHGSGLIDIQDADIRVATRHPWDLGAQGGVNLLKETYWTQSYRRSKSEDPKRISLFLCSHCSRLFTGPLDSAGPVCAECSSSKA